MPVIKRRGAGSVLRSSMMSSLGGVGEENIGLFCNQSSRRDDMFIANQ